MRVRWSAISVPSLVLSLAACNVTTGDDASTSAPPGADPSAAAPADPGAPSSEPGKPPTPAADEGAVFTISNASEANEVLAFARDASGKLSPAGVFPTGGRGLGKGLGSQGALALSEDRRVLVVVDAGSSQISSFRVQGTTLLFRSRVSSGGTQPISVTVHGGVVYALNAGEPSNVSGFLLDADGRLAPIAGSTRMLSTADAAPAQVSFSPKGDVLVVTEKGTDKIDTFTVRQDGTASQGEAFASNGKTPFGFAFAPNGQLVVTEAFGAAEGAGATSSYALESLFHAGPRGTAERAITSVSASVANAQTAPCWAVVSPDGKTAYTSNTPSGTVSAYAIDPSGALTLIGDGAAAKTGDGSKPVDMTLDGSGKHLYVLASGTQHLKTIDVAPDGALAVRPSGAEVPASAFGLAGF